jgi:hypothetical protein
MERFLALRFFFFLMCVCVCVCVCVRVCEVSQELAGLCGSFGWSCVLNWPVVIELDVIYCRPVT